MTMKVLQNRERDCHNAASIWRVQGLGGHQNRQWEAQVHFLLAQNIGSGVKRGLRSNSATFSS